MKNSAAFVAFYSCSATTVQVTIFLHSSQHAFF